MALTADSVLYIMHQHRKTMDGCACGAQMFWARDHEEHLAAVIAKASA